MIKTYLLILTVIILAASEDVDTIVNPQETSSSWTVIKPLKCLCGDIAPGSFDSNDYCAIICGCSAINQEDKVSEILEDEEARNDPIIQRIIHEGSSSGVFKATMSGKLPLRSSFSLLRIFSVYKEVTSEQKGPCKHEEDKKNKKEECVIGGTHNYRIDVKLDVAVGMQARVQFDAVYVFNETSESFIVSDFDYFNSTFEADFDEEVEQYVNDLKVERELQEEEERQEKQRMIDEAIQLKKKLAEEIETRKKQEEEAKLAAEQAAVQISTLETERAAQAAKLEQLSIENESERQTLQAEIDKLTTSIDSMCPKIVEDSLIAADLPIPSALGSKKWVGGFHCSVSKERLEGPKSRTCTYEPPAGWQILEYVLDVISQDKGSWSANVYASASSIIRREQIVSKWNNVIAGSSIAAVTGQLQVEYERHLSLLTQYSSDNNGLRVDITAGRQFLGRTHCHVQARIHIIRIY